MAEDERGSTATGAGHRVTVVPAAGRGASDHHHDHEPVISLRGVLLVGSAVLLGALLLPAATRTSVRSAASTSGRPAVAAPRTSTEGTGSTPTPAGGSGGPGTSTAPAGPTPSSVHVLVANGSTVNGLAASVSSGLTAKGYVLLPPVVALTTLPSTEVWTLTPTGNAAAAEVLAALGLPASAVVGPQGGPPPVSSGSGADLVVVAGPDVASRFPPPSSGG